MPVYEVGGLVVGATLAVIIGFTLREFSGWIIIAAAVLSALAVILRYVRMAVRWGVDLAANQNRLTHVVTVELPAIKTELVEMRAMIENGSTPNPDEQSG